MLLRKHILSPGKFRVQSPTGPVWKEFTIDDLRKAAANTNEMLTEGLKVPAPFGHHKDAIPKTEPADSPFNNAGYWEMFNIEPTESGELGLFGYVNTPGSDKEPESPYFKAKNTAKEVSLSFKENFVDGKGKTWNNILAHVALVNSPVFHGQEEFKDFPENSLTVNMSMAYTNTEPVENDIPALRKALLESFNISLPECNDIKQFVRDLLVAALQKKPAPNSSQTFEVSPVYMSLEGSDMKLTIDQARALVATNAINPATTKPFALTDFGYSENPNDHELSLLKAEVATKNATIQKLTALTQALSAAAATQIKETLTKRINQLVDKKIISADHAKAQLYPKLEFQMSLGEDGAIAAHPLEITLSTLEAVTFPSGGSTGTPVVNPLQEPQSPNQTLDDILKEIDQASF